MTRAAGGLTEVSYSFAIGGSERIAAAVAEFAVGKGTPAAVCSTHGSFGPISDSLGESGIECIPLQTGPGGRVGRSLRLFAHLRRHGTRVVHVHHTNMLAIAYRTARLAGVDRIVLTEHSIHRLQASARDRARARRFAPLADAVTVVHQGLADYLVAEVGVRKDRIEVVPNGVDTSRFRPGRSARLRSELGLGDDTCVVGYVGRLHPDKDPMNLMRAVAVMDPGKRAALVVLVVGDGESRAAAERFVADYRLGAHVRFLGERTDVDRLLHVMDVFALPSRTEGLPVALLEAMSCGIPPVATRVGGVPAAVGDAGRIVEPGAPGMLAAGLAELAADRELRARLGRVARERVTREYDRAAMFRGYARALDPKGDLLGL